MAASAEETAPVLVEKRDGVSILRLNRPQTLNALSREVMSALVQALAEAEADDDTGCIVLAGSARAFAAGADIAEMRGLSWPDVWVEDFLGDWDRVAQCRKPIVAAVAGYALGGGCELAMMCDIIIAARNAKFGQPEIKLGIIPGAGGTQRLVRAIGKAQAMDLILTGRFMTAEEALAAGLVSRVVDDEAVMDEALSVAKTIAGHSRTAVLAAKEAVLRAFETPLAEGVRYERRLFHALFATHDQKEGMAAFLEKRKPRWRVGSGEGEK